MRLFQFSEIEQISTVRDRREHDRTQGMRIRAREINVKCDIVDIFLKHHCGTFNINLVVIVITVKNESANSLKRIVQ